MNCLLLFVLAQIMPRARAESHYVERDTQVPCFECFTVQCQVAFYRLDP